MHKIAKLLGLALMLTSLALLPAQTGPAAPKTAVTAGTASTENDFKVATKIIEAYRAKLGEMVALITTTIAKERATSLAALEEQKTLATKAVGTLKEGFSEMIGDVVALVGETYTQALALGTLVKIQEPDATKLVELFKFSNDTKLKADWDKAVVLANASEAGKAKVATTEKALAAKFGA